MWMSLYRDLYGVIVSCDESKIKRVTSTNTEMYELSRSPLISV